jgi:hypothetical protein
MKQAGDHQAAEARRVGRVVDDLLAIRLERRLQVPLGEEDRVSHVLQVVAAQVLVAHLPCLL